MGVVRDFVDTACAASTGVMIDTARIYQQHSLYGDTETVLGDIFADNPSLIPKVHIATKAAPSVPPHMSLSRESIMEQCETSLRKLGLPHIDLYYLHFPDIQTDLDDSLAGIDELHKQGKIKEFGLSNYPAWAVADIWHRCKSRGMVVPTVYQGMYNVITRDLEREIVPVARQFGMRLFVYNPLAGGLLSGRYACIDDIENAVGGRFSNESTLGKEYLARYSKEPVVEGLVPFRQACEQHGIRMPDAAFRWLMHHSFLVKNDGVAFGISKVEHLAVNLAAWEAGPLPEALVDACDEAWSIAMQACEPYFRGYGELPGGIEMFIELLEKKMQA